MTPQERNTILVLIILITVGILLVAALPLSVLISGGLDPEFAFEEVDAVPPKGTLIKLTEDDYEKYPILRNIPESFYIDKSIISGFYIRPGCVDKETGYAIWETYASPNAYLEHNGKIYEVRVIPICN